MVGEHICQAFFYIEKFTSNACLILESAIYQCKFCEFPENDFNFFNGQDRHIVMSMVSRMVIRLGRGWRSILIVKIVN